MLNTIKYIKKLFSFSIILLSLLSNVYAIDLQLDKKPANYNVYSWCIEKAHVISEAQLKKVITLLGLKGKEEFSAFKNKHYNTIIANEYASQQFIQNNPIP